MRLLLVEDDEKLSRLLVQGLQESGYAVDLATDGPGGLDLQFSDPLVSTAVSSRIGEMGQPPWEFVQEHSTQTEATAAAVRLLLPSSLETLLDFGCGDGDLLARILGPRRLRRLELVDPDETSLQAARSRFPADEVVAVRTLAELTWSPVQLALANQVLFFVDDLESTLGRLVGKLASTGWLVITHAGREKSSTRLRERYFKLLGVEDPYPRAAHVEEALQRLAVPYETRFVESFVQFPDTLENRLLFLAYLQSEEVKGQCPQAAARLLDPYRHGKDIRLRNLDRLLLVTRD